MTLTTFRRSRKDRGRKRGKRVMNRLLGKTAMGRVVRGVAAGGLLVGTAALVHKSRQKPFTPKADRKPNPYRYDQPGRENYGKRSSVIQDKDWLAKRRTGSSVQAPSRESAGRSGVPGQRWNDAIQYDRLNVVNRRRRKRGLNRLPAARMSFSDHPLATFRKARRNRTQRKVAKVMREFKQGKLRSGGTGNKVRSRRQAIAIALSEARRGKR